MKNSSGFTLIEILIVVAIMGILGALILPNLIGQDDRAKATAAKADLQSVATALSMYHLDNGEYPSTEQGLDALLRRGEQSSGSGTLNSSGYLLRKPVDPWGRPYQYSRSEGGFVLYSLGKDGKVGGDGYARDISYGDP